ncbi:C6 transcription factor, partial [Penicillium cosmopolitanum]
SADLAPRRTQSEQATPRAADHRLGNIEEEGYFTQLSTGERTGPTSALDICSPGQSLPKHFLIPSHRKDLSDEDRDFLQRKGVFTLPGKNACDSMVEAYLLHVHPILPVVEADLLLQHHQSGQLHSYNTLLLWSLFFVAVNFIPVDICEEEGFPSRREMRFDMYSRAKVRNGPPTSPLRVPSLSSSTEHFELSCQLGKIMTVNYQAARSKPSLRELEMIESQLLQSRLPDQYEVGLMPSTRFYSNHVHLHYQAMLVTFYRPWGTDAPNELHDSAKKDWQHRMRLRADAAASRTNEILDALVQDDLLGFAGPMTPPLLVPAMQAHLLHCKTGDPLSKRVRLNKLEMCMLVMEELQKTYTAASIYRAVFTKALQMIFPGYSAPVAPFSSTANAAAAAPTTANVNVPVNSPMGADVPDYTQGQINEGDFVVADGNLMDALMDEASIFNFWETWNQI